MGQSKRREPVEGEDRFNPYRSRITLFPGKIFLFDHFKGSRKEFLEVVGERQVLCEIGSGSGAHLIELARRNPEAACVGFELRFKRAVRTIEKAQCAALENVFVLRTKGELIRQVFPAARIAKLYVNFPDPWAKPRQRKNRILLGSFLRTASTILQSGGILAVKTDHSEYFDAFLEEAEQSRRFQVLACTKDLYRSPYLEESIPTEFEKLFHHQGQAISYVKLQHS